MFLLLTALQIIALAMAQSQRDENKIIGGYTCIQNSQPWQAALLAGPFRRFLCGGALLSRQWVITAAHCARPILRIALGKHNLKNWEATQQVLRVVRQVPHPQYNSQTHNNDLMLLQLERPIQLGRAVRPITIASSCARPGTSCLVSGWGTTSSPIGVSAGLFPSHHRWHGLCRCSPRWEGLLSGEVQGDCLELGLGYQTIWGA
eukprot:XP_005615817.1 kallikrein-14 isoform X1 [Canis lupus familiaris]